MENYAAAANARYLESRFLFSHSKNVAAIHIGGISIECRLKELLIVYHRISDWNGISQRPKDPKCGCVINRPKHNLLDCLRKMNDLYKKAKTDPDFIAHLHRLNHPRGSEIDFIELRYYGGELTPQEMKLWNESFSYVWGWVDKNKGLVK